MFTTETEYFIKIEDLKPGGYLRFTRRKLSLAAVKEAVRKQYPDREDLKVFDHDTATYISRLMI